MGCAEGQLAGRLLFGKARRRDRQPGLVAGWAAVGERRKRRQYYHLGCQERTSPADFAGLPTAQRRPSAPQPPCEPKTSCRVLSGYIDGVTSVAWSPDGRLLATAGFGSAEAVRIWDVGTARLVAAFK